QAKSGIDCSFRQGQATRRVIDSLEVKVVMRLGQSAICEKKSRIASDRLIKQVHGLRKILLCAWALRGEVDERLGADIQVIRSQVSCRPILHRAVLSRCNLGSKSFRD